MSACVYAACVHVRSGARVRWWAEDVAVEVAVTVILCCIRVCDGGGGV